MLTCVSRSQPQATRPPCAHPKPEVEVSNPHNTQLWVVPWEASTSQPNLGEMMVRAAPSAAVWKKKPLLNLVIHGAEPARNLILSRSPKNKWRTSRDQATSVSRQQVLSVFFQVWKRNFTTRAKKSSAAAAAQIPLIFIKTKKTVKLPSSSFKRKLPTASEKEKT